MASTPLPVIDPDVDTGTTLAVHLNDWASFLRSTRAGAVRPVDVVAGGMWYRNTAGSEALVLFDGVHDVVVASIDVATGSVISTGVEIFIQAGAPAAPADGDLWIIPGSTLVGVVIHDKLQYYFSSAWHPLLDENSIHGELPPVVDTPPAGSAFPYMYLWGNTEKGAAGSTNNEGLLYWNGVEFVPSWPVVPGETMLQVTSSTLDFGGVLAIGAVHINTANNTVFVGDGDTVGGINVTATNDFADAAEMIAASESTKAVAPLTYRNELARYLAEKSTNAAVIPGDKLVLTELSNGKIHPSLTLTSGLGYRGLWTATAPPNEYPTVPTPTKGDYWIIANDPSYLFVGGDLVGQTVLKGDALLFNGAVWETSDGVQDTSSFIHQDGTVAMVAPLRLQSGAGASEMSLDYQAIVFAAGITFSIAPAGAVGGGGFRVLDDSTVEIVNNSGVNTPLVVSGFGGVTAPVITAEVGPLLADAYYSAIAGTGAGKFEWTWGVTQGGGWQLNSETNAQIIAAEPDALTNAIHIKSSGAEITGKITNNTDWLDLGIDALVTGFPAYSTFPNKYRKLPDNSVEILFSVWKEFNYGTQFAILPAEFRPVHDLHFTVVASGGAAIRIKILTGGVMQAAGVSVSENIIGTLRFYAK